MASKNTLDFTPLTPIPKIFPSFSWNGYQLAGFQSQAVDNTEQDLSQHPFSEAFFSCYPDISLAELARLYKKLQSSTLEFDDSDWRQLVAKYGWRWSDRLEKILYAIVQTPISFQNWTSLKKIGVNDWGTLLLTKENTSNYSTFLEQIAQVNPSSQEGKRILEWGIELSLIANSLEGLLAKENENGTQWCKRLEQMRFPNSHSRENSSQKKLLQLPKIPHVKFQWQREGDLSGLKVEFFCPSYEDYEKKVSSLVNLQEQLEKEETHLWKS